MNLKPDFTKINLKKEYAKPDIKAWKAQFAKEAGRQIDTYSWLTNEQIKDFGKDNFIMKPVNKRNLAKIIRNALDNR